ncbi:MAG: hypothetical protein IMY87_03145 [Chloroflexi bacterium]|nr:hypothetical protein [Chloroflexota bacterium]
MKRAIQRWELLLLFLAAGKASGRILDPVRIMKGMFLLEKGGALEPHSYNFEPYDYGPFSISLYNDLDLLESKKLIDRIARAGRNWSYVRVTNQGHKLAKSLEKQAKPEQLELISAVHEDVLDKTFADLLRHIYKKYPEYAGRSVFQG